MAPLAVEVLLFLGLCCLPGVTFVLFMRWVDSLADEELLERARRGQSAGSPAGNGQTWTGPRILGREENGEASDERSAESGDDHGIRCSVCGHPNDESYDYCRGCLEEL